MNKDDNRWMDILIDDKLNRIYRYKVIVDNDSVWIEDTRQEGKVCHEFSEYGYELVVQLFRYFGIYAELC